MKSKSFNAVRLADIRKQMAVLRQEAQDLKTVLATEKANMAEARLYAREAKARRVAEKQALAIVKAEARLARLMEKKAKPVGVKALRANRRPSKATVMQVAA
jgi:hypothetical protein